MVFLVSIVLASGVFAGQVLDRILAVVDGSPITLSDLNGAVRMGLVTASSGSERDALEALIERRLQLIEVNRYLPPQPAAAAIDARLAEIRQRFPTEAAFDTALKETGLTATDLRAAVRDSLRISSYLNQRFGSGYQPGEDEVLAYYRAHEADFTKNGVRQTYTDARDDARRRLIDIRTAGLVRDWVAGLRRRVEVTVLPR
jgi:hypothetical protein